MIDFIDAERVHRLLDFPYLVEGLRKLHAAPPPDVERLLMSQLGGGEEADHFLIWPAWQPGEALGVKLMTVFPENLEGASGLPSIQGLYLLFDGRDGRPLACIQGAALTYRKTAADSALGAAFLAREDAEVLLMVGAGAVAPYLVMAHRAVRPSIRRVLVWNRTAARAEALAESLGAERIDDLAQGVRAADVVCCATASQKPLIRGDWLMPGTHLDLVGGFTPAMREADDTAARRARVHVDSRWFTIEDCGDIAGPIASGAIAEADVLADLFELARGDQPGRRDAAEITLFKNAGGAHLDLMTARLLMRRLEDPDASASQEA